MNVEEIIAELDLLIRMDIPRDSYVSYGAQPNTDEDFDVKIGIYKTPCVTNRMNDIRRQWALLKPIIVSTKVSEEES